MSRIYTWFLVSLVPWLVLLGGVGGVWHGTGYLWLAWQSSTWPETEGSVIRAEVRSEGRFEQGADTERYWAEIEYQYEIEGTTFRSTVRTLDGLRLGTQVGGGRVAAEEVVSRFPPGERVAVFYDPQDPQRATLQTGIGASNLFVPLFGVVLILLALTWLGYMPFSRSLSRTSPQLDREWQGKSRTCPRCQTAFTSVQDKGGCPQCGHVFYASEAAAGDKAS